MASNIPTQVRTVDPFASYNSNTVNKLTRMITFNDDVLMQPNSLRLSLDSTSPTTAVIVSTGQCYKDDTLIEVTEEIRVDFEERTFYYNQADPFDEFNGYYYVVLSYRYVKSRPAPQATIEIMKISQTPSFSINSNWLFLGAVYVVPGATTAEITGLSDEDISNNSDAYRRYAREYAGSYTVLPTHSRDPHQGQIAYEVSTDQFYVGYEDRWEGFPQNFINIDTTTASVGDLCYTNASGDATPAIATAVGTGAEMVAVQFGVSSDGSGQARQSGLVSGVNVESTSPAISVGDLLYLSASEAGTVTSTQTSPLSQVVGRALSDESGSKVNMLFFPRDVLETGTASRLTDTLSGVDWVLDTGSYRGDVDITALGITGQDVVVSCRNTSTNMVESPQDVDLSVADTVRIWMPVNTVTFEVTVVG